MPMSWRVCCFGASILSLVLLQGTFAQFNSKGGGVMRRVICERSSDLRGLLVDGMYNIAVADVQVSVVASAQCKDAVMRRQMQAQLGFTTATPHHLDC